MKMHEKRQGRINTLYQRALNGKYTKDGKFSYSFLVADAMQIGVVKSTAEDYAEKVVDKLQDTGLLK